MLSEERKKEIISLAANLISKKSYSGSEEEAASVLSDYLERNYDEAFRDECGNVIGVIKGKRKGPRILFDGHLDTVPVTDGWKRNPFGAEIEDGKLYGRGASDMKGAVAAYAASAAFFASDTGRDFSGEIYVDGTVLEESLEGVSSESVERIVKPDYVIICEATECRVNIGQRGRAEIVIEAFGIPAHSSNPEEGVNAALNMMRIISELEKTEPKEHELQGKGIMALTDIISYPYPGLSVIPSYSKATYDRRVLEGEDEESVLSPIRKVIDELGIEARVSYAYGSQECYTGKVIGGRKFFPPWISEGDYIEEVLKETGIGSTGSYGFCTNGSFYAGKKKIKTLGLGPSKESLAHVIDEYVEIDELFRASEAYMGVMRALLK